MSRYQLHRGDCRDLLKTLADNSVDSIVTDPPYELGFMGKSWDNTGIAYDRAMWAEALRVAKPGAWLLAFGGTRTYHRLACAIEDAGWELRDSLLRGHMHQPEDCPWLMGWMYGSGFPKSHNGEWGGTALKPAWEPIVCARKPLIGTVSENFQVHGTGGLNIDGARIVAEPMRPNTGKGALPRRHEGEIREGSPCGQPHALGRWPANLVHDGNEAVLACFPDAPGQLAPVKFDAEERKTGAVYGEMKRGHRPGGFGNVGAAKGEPVPNGPQYLDTGSAARFFYCAKASKEDRNEGLEGLEGRLTSDGRKVAADNAYQRGLTERKNHHPTVKPTELMRYFIRLVTPKGGTVLDIFTGSGSTGKAAVLEGFDFIGFDLDSDEEGRPIGYLDIAQARIEHALRQGHQPGLDLEAA